MLTDLCSVEKPLDGAHRLFACFQFECQSIYITALAVKPVYNRDCRAACVRRAHSASS